MMALSSDSAIHHAPNRVKAHKCCICDRKFKRSEHCTRHERAHRQERPFGCRYCHKMYARKDLVKRHERTLHADEFQSDQRVAHRAPSVRNAIACDDLNAELRQDQITRNDIGSTGGSDSQRDNSEMLQDGTSKGMAMQIRTPGSNLYSEVSVEAVTNSLDISMHAILEGCANAVTDDIQTASVASALLVPSAERIGHELTPMQLDSATENIQNAPFCSADPSVVVPVHDGQPVSTNDFTDHLPPHPLEADIFSDLMFDSYFDPSTELLLPHFPHPNSSEFNGQPSSLQRRPSTNDSDVSYPYDRPTPTQGLGYSRRIFEQLPRVLQESSVSLPRLHFNQADYEALQHKILDQLGNNGGLPQIASAKELQGFLNSYTDCFHRHLPFLHLASLSPFVAPSVLILAMSSIGALYRLDRKRARGLFELATKIVSQVQVSPTPSAGSSDNPLWLSQAKVLLSLHAFFGGDPKSMSDAFLEVGYYTLKYRHIREDLAMTALGQAPSWGDWVMRESKRRVLCAMYILSSLVVTTYGVTPGFVNNTDLEFEAPEEETLWNAKNETEWKELARRAEKPRRRTVREIMTDVIGEFDESDNGKQQYDVPALTMLVIMHTVCIHMWLSFQYSQVLGGNAFSLPARQSLRLALLATTSSTLERCQQAMLQRGKEDQEISWDNPEGPLLFNCQALLRIASARQFAIVQNFNRLALFSPDPAGILDAVSAYASAQQTRNQFLTTAATRACEGFLSATRIGHMLVRKTAALNWSVEHAIAGWDSALFVTKWIHTVECEAPRFPLDAEEEKLFVVVKSHLAEMEFQHDESKSLAASLANAWSYFLSDVWVWGVTPKMGLILEKLSEIYQQRFETHR
ncbi:hypothetical protein T440DRAFT_86905 [Plenodomus tracheiphilus IPT5]|uniref:C2H2-type domain-containing protein n=1 Tax=Plenodomus tracheiphilus IPT5 TaxID=1408161 RepID=A0A6A7B5Z9_9PLEO|nr:hypothetical protein T440DRAFT_86905 [Plenodomus tracheiphilus IPT5]